MKLMVSRLLIRQALVIPVFFFLPTIIAGILLTDYSFINQHASEIALSDNRKAIFLLNFGAILTGFSCISLAAGIVLKAKGKYLFTCILLSIWGVSMISNGVFAIGNPLHGLYGVGLSIMILAFVACFEFKNSNVREQFFPITISCGILIFLYFWAYMVELEPIEYRGLSQRFASAIIFGWISYLAFAVDQMTSARSYGINAEVS